MNDLIVGVLLIVVGGLITHLWEKYWRHQPKVAVTHRVGITKHREIRQGGVQIECPGEMTFYNETGWDAERLKIFWPDAPAAIPGLTGEIPQHVARFDRVMVTQANCRRDVSVAEFVAADAEWARKLRPKVVDNFSMVVQYENDRGKKFYTLFKKVNGVGSYDFFRRRPRGYTRRC